MAEPNDACTRVRCNDLSEALEDLQLHFLQFDNRQLQRSHKERLRGVPQVHRGILKETGEAVAVKVVELPAKQSDEYGDIVRDHHYQTSKSHVLPLT